MGGGTGPVNITNKNVTDGTTDLGNSKFNEALSELQKTRTRLGEIVVTSAKKQRRARR